MKARISRMPRPLDFSMFADRWDRANKSRVKAGTASSRVRIARGFHGIGTIVAIYCVLLFTCQTGSPAGRLAPRKRSLAASRRRGQAAKKHFPRTNHDRMRHGAVSPRKMALRKRPRPAIAVQKRAKSRKNAEKPAKTAGFSGILPATQDEAEVVVWAERGESHREAPGNGGTRGARPTLHGIQHSMPAHAPGLPSVPARKPSVIWT